MSDYSMGKSEARYALALNPAEMRVSARRIGSVWALNVSIRVECTYPQRGVATLIRYPELKIQEGLFWVLEQVGWLHPYTMEWNFSITTDDARLTSI